jgi:starch phosphorylase
MSFTSFSVPYSIDERYSKKVAYFSMEFAIHQPLKIYSGGLGFLAGSHLRSAYDLRQNMIAVGILWKYGYYDQARNQDQTLQVQWNEKIYSYLEDTGIKFQRPFNRLPSFCSVRIAPKTTTYLKRSRIASTMPTWLPRWPSLYC